MSIKFFTGWHGLDGSSLEQLRNRIPNVYIPDAATISSVDGPRGMRALRCQGGGNSQINIPFNGYAGGGLTTYSVGAWFKFVAGHAPESLTYIQLLYPYNNDGSGDGVIGPNVYYDVGNERVGVSNADTTFLGASPNNSMPPNVWTYVALKVVVSATVGEVYLYLNGNLVYTGTSLDLTKSGGALASEGVGLTVFGGFGAGDMHIGPLYISTGEVVRRLYVSRGLPVSDASIDFTPSSGSDAFAMVDDGNTPDDDGTYNKVVGFDQKDLFDTNIFIPSTKVYALAVRARGKGHHGGDGANGQAIFDYGAGELTSNPEPLNYEWFEHSVQEDDADVNYASPEAASAVYNACTIGYRTLDSA